MISTEKFLLVTATIALPASLALATVYLCLNVGQPVDRSIIIGIVVFASLRFNAREATFLFLGTHGQYVDLRNSAWFSSKLVATLVMVPVAGAFVWLISIRYLDEYSRWLAGLATAISIVVLRAAMHRYIQHAPHHRGMLVHSIQYAREKSRRLRHRKDPGIPFGGVLLPSDAATGHFCICGVTKSGKTLTLRLLMQQALRRVGQLPDHRAFVYDGKGELLPLLRAMTDAPVNVLNPFAVGSAAWAIAKDVNTGPAALEMCEILVPQRKESQPFFSDAVRHLMYGAMLVLMRQRPRVWQLGDLLDVMGSADKLSAHLRQYADTARLASQYFKAETTLHNIMSASGTLLMRYGPIADAWNNATDNISLEEWASGESVLVLGNSEVCRSAIDSINQAIFRRASQILLSQCESNQRRSWVFLDEVREAKLEGLSRLLTQGRSKGVCVAIAFQDMDGLRDLYGERVANEIVGQCSSKAILRLASPATALWASDVIGAREGFEWSRGEYKKRQLVKRESVLASEFFDIPPTSRSTGLTGYYATAEYGVYRSHQSAQSLNRSLITATDDAGDSGDEPVRDAIGHPTVENEVKPDSTSQDPEPQQSMNSEPILNLQSFSRIDWTDLR